MDVAGNGYAETERWIPIELELKNRQFSTKKNYRVLKRVWV